MWIQQQIQLPAKPRGFHQITRDLVSQLPQLKQINVGLAHFFLQHTSASLAINENADADVRCDLENYFSRLAPENEPYFQHVMEGPDDMPAHIKSVILGVSLIVPISAGQLALGVWQGIYLCEHRNRAGKRSILVTLNGE